MRDDHGRMINEMNRSSHEKSIWKRIITVLACVVVFGTTYALILPAITMDAKKTMVCTEETASGHVHSEECKAQDGETLTCGYADYVIHTHDENCYDSEGNLICGLDEVKEHRHTAECYKEILPQTEGEDQEVEKELICSEPEVIYHEHNENCFDENGTLVCKEQQVLKHQHTDQCFVTENEDTKESQETEEAGQAETEELAQPEPEEGKEQETEEPATSEEEEKPEVKEPESKETENKETENKTPDAKSEETKNEETKNPQISKEEEKEEQSENKDSQKDKTIDTSKSEEKETTETQRKHKMTHKGKDYTVRVTFGEEAQLPSGVELKVEEIKQGSTEYQDYYKQAEDALPEDQGLMFCRFFDVSFVADGKKVEPKAGVDVAISYEDSVPQQKGVETNAIHFAEDGIEVIPAEVGENTKGEDTFTFTQDSFSVVGTAVSAIDLSDGSYIFYRDGYALGYTEGDAGAVAVTVDENGYVYPKDNSNSYSIDTITWIYQNGKFVNKFLNDRGEPNKYLYLGYGYVGLVSMEQDLQARIINNTIRIANITNPYSTGDKGYYLGFDQENKQFTSVDKFAEGDYLFGARVETVEETIIQPGDLEIKDQIKDQGVLVPQLNTKHFSGKTLTYVWYRSNDGKNSWTKVERKKVTGNSYNVAEDGSWLNVPLDGGADKYYKVVLMSVDGAQQVTTIESKTYHVPYYDQVQNGDFEEPVISTEVDDAEHYQPFLPNGTAGMVWKTTASDGEIEFISVASDEFKEMSTQWHNCESAAKGKQFVELNANMAGALYQDILTVPGATMYWSLQHRGRGPNWMKPEDKNPKSADTMYVVAMSASLAEQYTSKDALEKIVKNPSGYPDIQVKEITDDNTKWHYRTGEYQVPDSQYLTRFFFVAGDTSCDLYGNDPNITRYTVGNHLDDIHFSTELPPPETGKVNLEVNKTIVGLNETEAKALLEKLEFTIDGATVSGREFKNFKQNEDGSYTASYQIQKDIGDGISVKTSVSENLTTAESEGYERTGTTYAINTNKQLDYKNSQSIQITINDKGTGIVSFVNTYAPETVNMSILKLNDEKTPKALSGAVFSLEKQDGTDWKMVGDNISVDGNGLADIKDLSYDTLYRLTETKAPDGYSMLTEKIYFKIQKENGTPGLVPYDINGNKLPGWQEQTEVQNNDKLQLRITNNKKAMLPETGGSGTNWIYMMGTMLVLTGTILYGCQRKRRLERRNRL